MHTFFSDGRLTGLGTASLAEDLVRCRQAKLPSVGDLWRAGAGVACGRAGSGVR
jgi:hypothetical protein